MSKWIKITGLLAALTVTLLAQYTSDLCTGGTASAESTYGSSFPSNAFDNEDIYWESDGNPPQWLQYDFGAGNSKVITRYRLKPATSGYMPKDWNFQGSDAGGADVNWTTLHSVTNSGLVENTWSDYFDFSNSTTYRYYRIDMLSTYGTEWVVVREMEMMESTAPTVTTNAASSIGTVGATLNGTVNAKGYNTTVTFEYGLNTIYGSTVTADESPVSGSTNFSVSKAISGLSPSTAYHYRVVGVSSEGTTNGSDVTFTTAAIAPTTQATNVSFASIATTQMGVSWTRGNGANCAVFVKQASSGTASPLSNTTYTANTAMGSGTQIASTGWYCVYNGTGTSVTVTGLTTGTAYQVHVCEYNGGAGSELYLITSGADNPDGETTLQLATVTTDAAGSITSSGATLNGTVNANGYSTAVTFDYGLTDSYSTSVVATPSPVTGSSGTSVSKAITGLTPNTTYHYRVVGVNSAGTSNGSDLTFATTYPEINLKQGETNIADGGSYDYGAKSAASNTDVIFTIENTGTANLTLSGSSIIAITGTNADQFSVQGSQPTSPVNASGSTTFTIRFSPTTGGAKTAEIAIASDDANENPYNLTLNGSGLATIIFVNGENAALSFGQTNASPPQSNWLLGQFSLAGNATGATLNSVTVTLGGTYDSGDLQSTPFQIYASNTNSYGSASALGSSVADPGSGSDVTFSSLTDAIPSGTRYYWVTADISSSATGDDNIYGTADASGDLNISNGTLSGSSAYGKLNAGSDASLPVELSFFTAENQSGGVLLSWRTESEFENLGFVISRKLKVQSSKLDDESAVIASYLTNTELEGNGSSSTAHNYFYTDTDVQPGVTYVYRLSDIAFDGTVTVLRELTVDYAAALPEETGITSIAPNPFNPVTTIRYAIAKEGRITVRVIDLTGRTAAELVNATQAPGIYTVTWNATTNDGRPLVSGSYFLVMDAGPERFTQKMILIR